MSTFTEISKLLGPEVFQYIKDWMKTNHADELDFHRYRMKLLAWASLNEETSTGRILKLLTKTDSLHLKDLKNILADRVIGESMSKYLWMKILLYLNEEYRKILDFEMDRLKAETQTIEKKAKTLTEKIEVH